MRHVRHCLLFLCAFVLLALPVVAGCSRPWWTDGKGSYQVTAYDANGYPVSALVEADGAVLGWSPWRGEVPEGTKQLTVAHWLYTTSLIDFKADTHAMVVVLRQDEEDFAERCRRNEARGCYLLVEIALAAGNTSSFTTQVRAALLQAGSLASTACAEGSAPDCALLASMYLEEKGKPYDAERALELATTACGNKDRLGCLIQAEARILLQRELDQARDYLSDACAARQADACSWYAEALLVIAQTTEAEAAAKPDDSNPKAADGETMRRTALSSLEEGCRLGSPHGCGRLAELYFRGSLVPPNGQVSYGYATKSCAMASGLGCYYLAKLVADGYTEQPAAAAGRIFIKSCNLGYKDACSEAAAF